MTVEVLVTNGALDIRRLLKSFLLNFEIFPVTKITYYESLSFKRLFLIKQFDREKPSNADSITVNDETRVGNTLCHIFPET